MLSRSKIETIKSDILGEQYSLSIAYVSLKKSREINNKYRKKDKATNVLSFSLRKGEGELVLCNSIVRKEATSSGKNFDQYILFLVIHGMLHLKGMQHSSRMSRAEEKYTKRYDEKYFSGNRRGNLDNKSGGRRIHARQKKSGKS